MGRNIYTTQIKNKHRKVGMAILITKNRLQDKDY